MSRTTLWTLILGLFLAALILGAWELHASQGQPASCASGACTSQTTLTIADSEQTFTYGVGTSFTVSLNENENPQKDFSMQCSPQGTIGPVSTAPSHDETYYALSFQGLAPGTCTLSDDNFFVTVSIVPSSIQ